MKCKIFTNRAFKWNINACLMAFNHMGFVEEDRPIVAVPWRVYASCIYAEGDRVFTSAIYAAIYCCLWISALEYNAWMERLAWSIWGPGLRCGHFFDLGGGRFGIIRNCWAIVVVLGTFRSIARKFRNKCSDLGITPEKAQTRCFYIYIATEIVTKYFRAKSAAAQYSHALPNGLPPAISNSFTSMMEMFGAAAANISILVYLIFQTFCLAQIKWMTRTEKKNDRKSK